MTGLIERLGGKLLIFFQSTGEVLLLLRLALGQCRHALKRRDRDRIFKQMLEIGVNTLPIAALMAFFVGLVLALQSGDVMKAFNLENRVGTLVGLAMVLELGPVQSGFLLAGRIGAAITAEIGTMKVSEEIDALEVMGVDKQRFLSMPRLLACVIMLPALLLYVDVIGIAGGAAISATYLGVKPAIYAKYLFDVLTAGQVLKSLIKAIVFGIIVAVIGCYKGFTTTGGAEGVGKFTTQSVVTSFILILVFDYFVARVLLLF